MRQQPAEMSFARGARAVEASKAKKPTPTATSPLPTATTSSSEADARREAALLELLSRIREAQQGGSDAPPRLERSSTSGSSELSARLTALDEKLSTAFSDFGARLTALEEGRQTADVPDLEARLTALASEARRFPAAELDELRLAASGAETRAQKLETAQAALRAEFASVAQAAGNQVAERVSAAEQRLKKLEVAVSETTPSSAFRSEVETLRAAVARAAEALDELRALETDTAGAVAELRGLAASLERRDGGGVGGYKAVALEAQCGVEPGEEVSLLLPFSTPAPGVVALTFLAPRPDGSVDRGSFVVERDGVPLVALL